MHRKEKAGRAVDLLLQRTLSAQVSFLLTELDLGTTFAEIAANTKNRNHKTQLVSSTYTVIQTVTYFLSRCKLDASDETEIRLRIDSLQSKLESLEGKGVHFSE